MKPEEVGKKMETQSSNLDRISTLPQSIIEKILILMPIQEALRTSILSKKWRYSWRSMPELEFTENMVKVLSHHGWRELKKYKLVNAIFHVLMFHNGPTILKFNCFVAKLHMFSEFDQIISYLSRGNSVKQVILTIKDYHCNLPVSFFSLQGLENIHLKNCGFEPPLTFNGFSRLKRLVFVNVNVSAKMLQGFLPNCPLLDEVRLVGCQKGIEFVVGGNKFTFGDLCHCVPLIRTFQISKYYMKYLCAGCIPHKLPTSLVHLQYLFLDVCLMDQNEISTALCMIRRSLVLEKIIITMYDIETLHVGQTPTNFLDLENHSDLKLNHLKILEIEMFSNLPLEMEFVKLIMAKSPELKTVQINLNGIVSVDEELKMLRDLVRLPLPRASPSAELIIKRPQSFL